jgi:uncharacterized protein YndB with AHSA1/START domain
VNEILQTLDGRSVLRMERRLAHPAEKVWRAITEPSHLAAWFPSQVEMPELVVGGKLRFVFGDDEGPTLDGEIAELDPPWIFGFTWGDDHLRIELRPDDGGRACVLVFTHVFDDTAGAASFAAGWDACLAALDSSLAGGPVRQGDPDAMDERHEAFVEAFGLTEGKVETTDDGWRVRFERQLVRPAATAWATLIDGAEPEVGGDVPAGFAVAAFPAGPVTVVEPEAALAYEWLDDGGAGAGEVRWELTTGTGQGARLIVTQTGPADRAAARQTALAAWPTAIGRLAHTLTTTPNPRRPSAG